MWQALSYYFDSHLVYLSYRDRVRTAVNVMGDCYCSGVMSHWFQHEFENGREDETQVVFNNGKEAEETSSF